jgi:hypothetical protein
MSNDKQSSVEWLSEIIRFANKELYAEMFEAIEQAKEMEKEQHVQIWNDSLEEVLKKLESLKQYYNSNQRRR